MASKHSDSLEWKRALFHVGVQSFVLWLSFVVPNHIAMPIAVGLMALVISIECLRVFHSGFGEKMQEMFSTMYREEELGKRSAMLDAAVGVACVYFLFPHEIFVVAVLLTAFPDPVARVVGKTIGKHPFPGAGNKTYAGCCAFFLTAFSLTLLFKPVLIAIVVALVAMLVEAYSNRHLRLDDNLTIPVTVALTLTLMS